jgi:hypothetical protein
MTCVFDASLQDARGVAKDMYHNDRVLRVMVVVDGAGVRGMDRAMTMKSGTPSDLNECTSRERRQSTPCSMASRSSIVAAIRTALSLA